MYNNNKCLDIHNITNSDNNHLIDVINVTYYTTEYCLSKCYIKMTNIFN